VKKESNSEKKLLSDSKSHNSNSSEKKDRHIIPFPSLTPITKEQDKNKTFIKIDYLKPAKNDTQKSRDEVSRVLDFNSSINNIKKEAPQAPIEEASKKRIKLEETNEAKQEVRTKIEATPIKTEIEVTPMKVEVEVTPAKTEIKVEKVQSKSSTEKSSSHHRSHHHHHNSSNSNHHKSHSSSSNSHHKSSKSSSGKSRSSSSRRECSKCYRRSKIKKVNTGVQTRVETESPVKQPTRKLEFEASHRVGVNRAPVTIDTNLSYLKYGRFYHIEVHPNGGASIVHMYQDELDTLSEAERNELVDEFFELVFSEDENNFAYHVMGVVHDGARYIPDLLEHMAENYSTLTVKAGVIGKNNDIETCSMLHYYEQVSKNYDEGTVRFGPLHQISLVGKVHEEVGGYFPDLLGKLEQNKFLKKAMPWGKLSIVQMDPR
jgi:lysine-specific demethylase 9